MIRLLIPAAPGWRVAEVYADGDETVAVDYEPIVAWVVLEDSEHEDLLIPCRRDGRRAVIPVGEDESYFAILAPGEEIDPDSDRWKFSISIELERQRKRQAP